MKDNLKNTRLHIVIPLLGVVKGGGLRVLCELANGLASRGHIIYIVTPSVDVFPFPLNKGVQLITKRANSSKSKITEKINDFIFVYKTSKDKGTILLSNYFTTFFIGWMTSLLHSKKHVYFIQGFEPDFFDKEQNCINKFKSFLASITYKIKPDLRITISQFLKDKIGKKDIIIIDDGINPNVFKPSNDKCTTNKKKIIGTIALTEVRKGFYDFIKAVEIINSKRSDFEILLFTPQRDIKFEIPFSHIMIYPSNDLEIVECLQNCDIFISPSHLEGFGLPGLEAMACGAALITTNSGGITQYAINEKNSLIINKGDIKALVLAIERLLDQPLLIRKLSEAGLVTSKMFTWEIMCENFEKELIKLQNNRL